MLIEDVGALYKNYYKDLYRYIYFMTFNNHDTEDILQNVFIKVMRGKDCFRGDSHIKTWIFSIAHNECINYLNRKRKIIHIENLDVSIICANNNIEEKILNREAVDIVMGFIQSCEEPVRSLLILRLIEEKSFMEIGNIINRSDTWCRVTFFRTKKNLISVLDEYGGEKTK
ncbi:RNA polymerase sigma factor [Kineothrix sp. MB12-C1]|uniref:RNA polymerase sigma factor n=1 Tax=Kineothrix sp. MB12-C1 TaxID=3070215 RepID=UPI0027D30B04|nr:sigma-70 family RNA polymerase sigma factor [Kineothrix sp. MB12-C1]WMC94369.1 sigma-70 family RNA polymerase sigma factor [Kineothrix sp. MB12-C1]